MRPWEKMIFGMKFTEVRFFSLPLFPLSFLSLSLSRLPFHGPCSLSFPSQSLIYASFVRVSYTARSPPLRPRSSLHRQLPLLSNRLRRIEGEVHSASTDLDGAQFGEREFIFFSPLALPLLVSFSSCFPCSFWVLPGRGREGVLGPVWDSLEVESVGVRFRCCFADLMEEVSLLYLDSRSGGGKRKDQVI